jgi:HK97 family phage prohead protease
MKNLEFKNFEIQETKADDSGNLIISGYGAIFGNIDAGGDVIQMGAFANTLEERKDRIAFCYQHDIWHPIAKIQEIKEDVKGLYIRAMISASEDDIQVKIKEGILKEMSIGYQTVESRNEMKEGKQVRVLTKVSLYEVSIVTVAMNQMAMIETMKSEEKQNMIEKEFDRVLAIVRNDNINYEILKLKSLVLSVAPPVEEPAKPEPQLKADEILKLLNS